MSWRYVKGVRLGSGSGIGVVACRVRQAVTEEKSWGKQLMLSLVVVRGSTWVVMAVGRQCGNRDVVGGKAVG